MIYLPKAIPAVAQLRTEGYDVSEYESAASSDGLPVGTLKILLLNLMPKKAETELDISRMLACGTKDVALLPMKIAGQTYKTTPMAHMSAFYKDFDEYASGSYDGLVVTGAPVEHLPFESVRYWTELCLIFDWAKSHVRSTLCICWGAQAALYHLYHIKKHPLPQKMFGVFEQRVLCPEAQLMQGLSPSFPMPNSRHTSVSSADVTSAGLQLLAESDESGFGVAQSVSGRFVFVVGHLEYHASTLNDEYKRDVKRGLPIIPPRHYYIDDVPERGFNFTWCKVAKRFYCNWLMLCGVK